MLVDTSDSITPNFLAELKATDQFAARLCVPIDRVSWAGFAARLETYPATPTCASVPPAFGRTAIGQTALYDAIYDGRTSRTKWSPQAAFRGKS